MAAVTKRICLEIQESSSSSSSSSSSLRPKPKCHTLVTLPEVALRECLYYLSQHEFFTFCRVTRDARRLAGSPQRHLLKIPHLHERVDYLANFIQYVSDDGVLTYIIVSRDVHNEASIPHTLTYTLNLALMKRCTSLTVQYRVTDRLLFYLSSYLPHLTHLAIPLDDEEFSDETLTAFRKLMQLRSLEVSYLASFGTFAPFTNLTALRASRVVPYDVRDHLHFPSLPETLRTLIVYALDTLDTCCIDGVSRSSPLNNVTHLEYRYTSLEHVIPYFPKLESVVLPFLPKPVISYPNEHVRSITVVEKVDQQELDLLCNNPQLQRSLTNLSFNVNQFNYGPESLRELSKLSRLTKLAMGCLDKVVDGPMVPMRSVLEVASVVGVVAEEEGEARELDRKVAAEWFPCAQIKWVRKPVDFVE